MRMFGEKVTRKNDLVQLAGAVQCNTVRSQDRDGAGRGEPVPVVALPENAIDCPTDHVWVDSGAAIAGTGALPSAVIVSVVLDEAPSWSVTVRRAVYTS